MRSNFGAERKRLRAVEHNERTIELAHLFQTMQMDIARNGADAVLDGLRGLVARRGAQIEKSLAGVQIEERHNGLRSDVLDAAGAGDVGLGRLKERGGDFGRCLRGRICRPIFRATRRGMERSVARSGHGTTGGRFFAKWR